MDKTKLIKGIGIGASILGVGLSLLTDWVNEKKTDEKIKKYAYEAVSEQMKK